MTGRSAGREGALGVGAQRSGERSGWTSVTPRAAASSARSPPGAGREPVAEHPSARRELRERRARDRTADAVEDDVERARGIARIAGRGAERRARSSFPAPPAAPTTVAPAAHRELDEQRADAARGGLDQHALARRIAAALEQRRRAPVGEQRDGVVERHPVRHVESAAPATATRSA